MAARWCGVRVLRLSVGLGPEILGYTDQNGTRWTLAALPLGGSLEMIDERDSSAKSVDTFSQKKPSVNALRYVQPDRWRAYCLPRLSTDYRL